MELQHISPQREEWHGFFYTVGIAKDRDKWLKNQKGERGKLGKEGKNAAGLTGDRGVGSDSPDSDLLWLCPSTWAVQVRALPWVGPGTSVAAAPCVPLSGTHTLISRQQGSDTHVPWNHEIQSWKIPLSSPCPALVQCQGLHSCFCHFTGVFSSFLAMVKSPLLEGTPGTLVWCLQAGSWVLPGSQPGDSSSAGPLSGSQAVSRAGEQQSGAMLRGHSQVLTKLHFRSVTGTGISWDSFRVRTLPAQEVWASSRV